MCFSATASFIASGGLATAGAISLRASKKSERLLATIPILFAVQQFIEGLQWLAPHPSPVCQVYGYGFLAFALIIWPTYVPIAAHNLEQDAKRKRILAWFVGAGVLYSTMLFVVLLQDQLSISILPKGIFYGIEIPFEMTLGSIYLLITCGSILLSTHPFFKWFGSAMVASALFTFEYFRSTFISVWCFFAAILSLSICVYLLRRKMADRIRMVFP